MVDEKAKFKQEAAHWESVLKVMNGGGGVKVVTAEQAAFFVRR